MSKEGAVTFLQKAVSDSSIMNQITELAKTSDDPAAAISNYAAELGCEITGAEFTWMVDDLAKVESRELSPDELEAVAGGVDSTVGSGDGIQEVDADLKLQYLQLQNDMQAQNRQFTLVSNIMKVKHDTAKASINNVR